MKIMADQVKGKTIIISDKINSNVILKNCIVNLAFMVFFLLLGPIYEENDDVGIERIASGFFGEPSSYLVFCNILIGKFLSTLYRIIPSIKWYALFMYGITFISFCVFSIICDKIIANSALSCVIKYPFIIIMGYEIYCMPQFTKTAGVSTMAGGCLLVYNVIIILLRKKNNNLKINYISILVAIAMLWVGSMIRIEAFILVIPFILVALSREIIKKVSYDKVNKRNILEALAIFGITVFVIGGTQILDRNIYSNDEAWKYYQNWNGLRGKVVDFNTADYYEFEDKYREIGMSENDYFMLKHWGFGDVDYYTNDRLQAVLDIDASTPKSEIDIVATLEKSLKYMLFGLSGKLFLYILVVWLVTDKKKLLDSLCVLGVIAFIAAFALYYGSVGRILNRVNVVVFLGTFLVIMFCMDDAYWQIERDNKVPLIIAGLVMALLSNKFCDRIEEYKNLLNKEAKYQERTLEIAADSDVMYVNDVSQNIFDEAWYGVFDRIPQNIRFTNVVAMGGWEVNSPSWKAQMFSMGITNIFRDSVDNERVLFITNEERKPHIETYINEHYNPLARLNKVIEFQDGTGYYNVITKPDYNAFDLSVTDYEDNLDEVVHYIRATDNGDEFYIDGTVYRTGLSSYEQEVFLICENGISMNVMKKESRERDDDYNGQYGNFSIEVDKGIVENSLENVYIILVTDGKLYKIQIDEVI